MLKIVIDNIGFFIFDRDKSNNTIADHVRRYLRKMFSMNLGMRIRFFSTLSYEYT